MEPTCNGSLMLTNISAAQITQNFCFNCMYHFFAALGLPQLCGLMAVPAEVKVCKLQKSTFFCYLLLLESSTLQYTMEETCSTLLFMWALS